jgi:hypothetical protein
MAMDDYLEPEVMVAVAVTATVTAAVASPPVRKALRKGAVYGLAGLLTLGDKVYALAQDLAHNAQQAAHGATAGAQQPDKETAPG